MALIVNRSASDDRIAQWQNAQRARLASGIYRPTDDFAAFARARIMRELWSICGFAGLLFGFAATIIAISVIAIN